MPEGSGDIALLRRSRPESVGVELDSLDLRPPEDHGADVPVPYGQGCVPFFSRAVVPQDWCCGHDGSEQHFGYSRR